jgi:hypothetical protein
MELELDSGLKMEIEIERQISVPCVIYLCPSSYGTSINLIALTGTSSPRSTAGVQRSASLVGKDVL